MDIKKLLVAVAMISTLCTNSALAAGIACVDVTKVVNASYEVKLLKTEQQLKNKNFLAQIDKARKEIAGVTDTKKKQALEAKYNKEFEAQKAKMDKEYAERLKTIEASISSVIAKEAKTKGYDVILSKGIVLYGGDDITGDVIKVVSKSNKK